MEESLALAASSPREALSGVVAALEASYQERSVMVGMVVRALIARQHVLFLGVPGTAKSALVRSLCSAFHDATYFKTLLHKFSLPEDVFGPMSLAALKQDRFARNTAGRAPEAHIVFLDEIFKANAAILSSLLTLLAEREFDNDGKSLACPLETCVGASNEIPEEGELAALYDRFLVRLWVEPIQGRDAFVSMIGSEIPVSMPCMSLADLHSAQREAAQLPIGSTTLGALFDMRAALVKAGVSGVSDRRWKWALGLLRADAWMAGDHMVGTDNFPVLEHVLWSVPEQRVEVAKVVGAYLDKSEREASAVLANMRALLGNDRLDVMAKAKEVRHAEERLTELSGKGGARSQEKIAKMIATLRSESKGLRAEARAKMGL